MLEGTAACQAIEYCWLTSFVLFKHQVISSLESDLLQVWEKLKGQPGFWRKARGWTKPEFIANMRTIVNRVHEKADLLGLDTKFIFAFDNPITHDIDEDDLGNLREGEYILRPPRYSPELMQAIEHSHGYTTKAYHKARLELGHTSWDIQAEWRCLREVFFEANTPEVVSKTVARIPEAARQIILAKGGRIPAVYR